MFESKILFATDFTGNLRHGLRLATDLSLKYSATLLLLHVVPFRANDGEALLHRGSDASLQGPEELLKGLAPTDPGVPYRHILETGEPEDRILDVAKREGVERIVLEIRPRSLLRDAFRRSVAKYVTVRAPCPVVTYRASRPSTGFFTAHRHAPQTHTDVSFEALRITLGARVDALEQWLSAHRSAVRAVADRASVQDRLATLAAGEWRDLQLARLARARRLLELEIGEFGRAMGAIGVHVLGRRGEPLLCHGVSPDPDDAYARFLERVQAGGAAVSVPLSATSNGPRSGGVVLSAATVPERGAPDVLLVYVFDARSDFLRILAQPGPTPSSEIYAFDENGIMLSNSRFADQLRQVGLLPRDETVQTPRLLRLSDPGGNLLAGYTPIPSPDRCPLTVMAKQATAGQSGFDNRGYRDYRGVEVVGIWHWLDAYGFGVAAEMERSAG